MCVKWVGDWTTAEKDITAFKAVLRNGKHYQSCVPLKHRDGQQKAGTKGAVLEYRRGRYAEGDDPGIYCFETPAMAKCHHQEDGIAVVAVKIPKGTKIRRGRAIVEDEQGRALELLTINAMRVKVLGEIDEKLCRKALWPRAQPVDPVYLDDTPTWNYFTITAGSYTSATTAVSFTWVSE